MKGIKSWTDLCNNRRSSSLAHFFAEIIGEASLWYLHSLQHLEKLTRRILQFQRLSYNHPRISEPVQWNSKAITCKWLAPHWEEKDTERHSTIGAQETLPVTFKGSKKEDKILYQTSAHTLESRRNCSEIYSQLMLSRTCWIMRG